MQTTTKPSHPPRWDEAALALLACPVCQGGLAQSGEQEIACSGCGRRYPVRDGLLVLLASAALEQ